MSFLRLSFDIERAGVSCVRLGRTCLQLCTYRTAPLIYCPTSIVDEIPDELGAPCDQSGRF
jgi:hypothetical protein